MRVKSLVLGAVAAVGLFALTAAPASAQVVYTAPPVITAGPTYVVPAPVVVTRPAYVVPSYGYGYGYRPGFSFGYSSGGYYRPAYGGYYGGYRGGYYGRPGFSFGVTFR